MYKKFAGLKINSYICNMITKEQYDEASIIIDLYREQQAEQIEKVKDEILKKIHERTEDKSWYLSVGYDWEDTVYIELSHMEYDEDYGGYYDKYFKELGTEYGIKIKVDYGLYGK